jgi:hypothetical protein
MGEATLRNFTLNFGEFTLTWYILEVAGSASF